MQVRSATSADIPAITSMKQIEDQDRYTQRIKETEEGKSSYLVAEQDGRIVGQVFLKYYGTKSHPSYPDMEDLFVDEQFRGQGVGTLLINTCEKLVKEKGHTKIGLSVNPDLNQKAKDLYFKLGYTSLGENAYLDAVYNGVEDWVIDLVKTI